MSNLTQNITVKQVPYASRRKTERNKEIIARWLTGKKSKKNSKEYCTLRSLAKEYKVCQKTTWDIVHNPNNYLEVAE